MQPLFRLITTHPFHWFILILSLLLQDCKIIHSENVVTNWVRLIRELKRGSDAQSSNLAVIGFRSKAEMYPSTDKSSGMVVPSFLPCEPWNSCIGRCDTQTNDLYINYPPYTCYCDSLCALYNDCCEDYFHSCLHNVHIYNTSNLQFSCIDLGYDRYGILMVGNCNALWEDNITKDACLNGVVDPVTDDFGLVYKNGHCAICNGIDSETRRWEQRKSTCQDNVGCSDYFQEPIGVKLQPRRCVHNIGTCSDKFVTFPKAIAKCTSFSGMVLVEHPLTKKIKKYKNPYCGLCNGEDPDKLICPQWEWKYSSDEIPQTPTPLELKVFGWNSAITYPLTFDVDRKNYVKGMLLPPPSTAVLFNFGLNGKKAVYYSNKRESLYESTRCSKNQIWDPFLDLCHNLTCTSDFSLINYRCSQDTNTTSNSRQQHELTQVVSGLNPNKVIVNMMFQAKSLCRDKIVAEETLVNELPFLLSSTLGINKNRISNVTLNNNPNVSGRTTRVKIFPDSLNSTTHYYSYIIDVKFYLTEPVSEEPEPSIDRLMSLLINGVNLNTMFMYAENLPLRLLEVHEQTLVENEAEFDSWCRDGQRHEYSNNEFTIVNTNIIQDDWKMQIYINSTGELYNRGEYVANFILICNDKQGSNPFIHGVVVVCENTSRLESKSCPRLLLQESEFIINENRTVTYLGSLPINRILLRGEFEISHDGLLSVCYNVSSNYGNFMVQFDAVQAYLSLCLNCLSLLAMSVTFFTYAFFRELRNLPGVNLMNLIFSLFAFQLTFFLGIQGTIESRTCQIVAIALHYLILLSFFWTNIMAYDLFKTFGNNTILPLTRTKRQNLKYYITFAYLTPAIIVSISIALDICKCIDSFWVGYGQDLCWISNPTANIIFFAIPIGVILLVNFGFYVITIYRIIGVFKKTKSIVHKNKGNDVHLYIRMSTVMGFTWIFGFAAQFVNPFSLILTEILTYLFIIFNSLQGLLICWAFVCKKRIFNLYKKSIANGMESVKKRKLFVCESISVLSSRESSRSTSLDSGHSQAS